jgi:nitroreductase
MTRTADHAIDPMFLERWSPRAYDGQPISREELLTVLEAGRWAPSAFNAQPWRYVYAQRDTAAWASLLGLLFEINQSWAKNAAALVVIVSQKDMPPGKDGSVKPSRTHSFDAGASWAMIALEARRLGLYAHGMSGFDAERAAIELEVPDTFHVDAMFALGRVTSDLSGLLPALVAKESPNDRRPLLETAFEGRFAAKV